MSEAPGLSRHEPPIADRRRNLPTTKWGRRGLYAAYGGGISSSIGWFLVKWYALPYSKTDPLWVPATWIWCLLGGAVGVLIAFIHERRNDQAGLLTRISPIAVIALAAGGVIWVLARL
jgi:hypothetical protein